MKVFFIVSARLTACPVPRRERGSEPSRRFLAGSQDFLRENGSVGEPGVRAEDSRGPDRHARLCRSRANAHGGRARRPLDAGPRGRVCHAGQAWWRLLARVASMRDSSSSVTIPWTIGGWTMKNQRLLVVLTILNLGLLTYQLARPRIALGQEAAPVLRGRALELVDD